MWTRALTHSRRLLCLQINKDRCNTLRRTKCFTGSDGGSRTCIFSFQRGVYGGRKRDVYDVPVLEFLILDRNTQGSYVESTYYITQKKHIKIARSTTCDELHTSCSAVNEGSLSWDPRRDKCLRCQVLWKCHWSNSSVTCNRSHFDGAFFSWYSFCEVSYYGS